MRHLLFPTAFALVLLASACGSGQKTELDTFVERSSYAVGMDIGNSMVRSQADIDFPSLAQGISDALEGREPLLSEQEAAEVLRQFAAQLRESQQAAMQALVDKNVEEGNAFLAENKTKEGVTTTQTGLQYQVLNEGDGATPAESDQVTVHYRGTLVDGTEFDSSYEGEPVTFPVTGVIGGWTEALQLMRVGGKYRIVVPPDLGYGERGSPPAIGPNAVLIFEIELLAVTE